MSSTYYYYASGYAEDFNLINVLIDFFNNNCIVLNITVFNVSFYVVFLLILRNIV